MKRILLCILGIFIIIIQNSIINYLSIFGMTINIVLIYLVIISLYLEELESGIIGAILGIVLDSSAGGIFGSNALILFLLSYMVSYLRNKIYKESLVMIFTIILVTTLIYCGVSFLFARLLYNVCKFTSIIKIIVVPIVNALVGILVYRIFKDQILKLEEE
ncbi:MAG: rod shape-determining protein MreD [Intestinibacter sp.]